MLKTRITLQQNIVKFVLQRFIHLFLSSFMRHTLCFRYLIIIKSGDNWSLMERV